MSFARLVKKIISKHINPETGIPETILIGWIDNSIAEEHLARYMVVSKMTKGTVLDVACGSGYGSSIINRHSRVDYVVSMDIEIELLEYGKRVFKIEAVEADALNLPFRNKSFDTVVTLETIEHLSNPKKFIKQIRRVLKDNGILILSTPNKLCTSPLLKKPLNPYHTSEFYLGEILKILTDENLIPICILCGKPIGILTFVKRLIGSILKSLIKTIKIKPVIIDYLYKKITDSINLVLPFITDNVINSSKYRFLLKNEVDPVPSNIIHKIIYEPSNFILYEYFVIIAKKINSYYNTNK